MPESYIAEYHSTERVTYDPQKEAMYTADMVSAYKSIVFGLTTSDAVRIVAQETGKSLREVLAAVRQHGLDD